MDAITKPAPREVASCNGAEDARLLSGCQYPNPRCVYGSTSGRRPSASFSPTPALYDAPGRSEPPAEGFVDGRQCCTQDFLLLTLRLRH